MLDTTSAFFQVLMKMSDISATLSSLLRAYQQVTEEGESAILTVEMKGGVETVTLNSARTAGAPAACREVQESGGWRTPASPDWRTPGRQRLIIRNGGMEGVWPYPPTPVLSKRKSPSKFKRDTLRYTQ